MDNPSLRVNRHGGSTSKTFIVEDYTEDEFGQWATDKVTGEQGYIDDERSCFWTLDDNEYTWQSRPLKSRQKGRGKGTGKGKGGFKGTGRAFFCEEQAQDFEDEDCVVFGGPKERTAREAFRKVMKVFGMVVFVIPHQKRVQAMMSTRTKAESRTKKERATKVLILNPDFQPRKHPEKKNMAILGNQMIELN